MSTDASRRLAETLGRQADELALGAAGANYYIAPDGARRKPTMHDANSGPFVRPGEDLAAFVDRMTPPSGREGLFDWFRSEWLTEDDLHRLARVSAKDLKAIDRESSTSLFEALANKIRAISRARRGGEGAHEWYMVASLPYLKRMGIDLDRVTDPRFTSPTSLKIRDPNLAHLENSPVYTHAQSSKPKKGLSASDREHLGEAARLFSKMHQELEDATFLAANSVSPNAAMAIGFRATAERWLPRGVKDLPIGLQEFISDVEKALAKEGKALPSLEISGGDPAPEAILKFDPTLLGRQFPITDRYLRK